MTDESELTPEEFDAACHAVGEEIAAEYARIVREAHGQPDAPEPAPAKLSLSAADKVEIADMVRSMTPMTYPAPPPQPGLADLTAAIAALATRPQETPVVRIEPGAIVVNNLPPPPVEKPPASRIVRGPDGREWTIKEE